MKVVILAGGFGTRISEYTKFIPKPMIRIKGLPILIHIMRHYSKFGFNEFYIALGYKGNVIKNYFKHEKFNWKINLLDTGKNTMTGGRLKKLAKYLKGESFFLTYGDGLSDVNIMKLLRFHKKNNKFYKESALLKLNSKKAKEKLNWKPVLTFKENIFFVADWYKNFYLNSKQAYKLTSDQIEIYQKILNKRGLK